MTTERQDKIILTFSNIAALPSIIIALYKGYFCTGFDIFFGFFFSVFHHAIEIRFYKPALINVHSEWKRFIILQLDRIFALNAMLSAGSIKQLIDYWQFCVLSFSAMILSDVVMYIPDDLMSLKRRRWWRVRLHTFWHCSAFFMALIAVLYYIDEPSLYGEIFIRLGLPRTLVLLI